MPTFNVEPKKITAFEVGGAILFKEYIGQDELFDQLRKYYNLDKYRFEIPEEELDEVRQIIDRYYYELSVVDNLGQYCVVAGEDSNTKELFKMSVMRIPRNGREIYVMKDSISVKQAVERGATQPAEPETDSGQPRRRIDRSDRGRRRLQR